MYYIGCNPNPCGQGQQCIVQVNGQGLCSCITADFIIVDPNNPAASYCVRK